MEFRGNQSTYARVAAAGRRHAVVPALRLALPRAGQGDGDEPRRPLPVGRRAARPAARRPPRGGGRRQRHRGRGALRPRRRCSARRPAPVRSSTWAELPALRVDRSDAMATWLAGVSLADGAQRLEVLEQAPEQTVEVQLAKARAAIDASSFPLAAQVLEQVLTDNPWEWRAMWLSGLAALAQADHDAAATVVQHGAGPGAGGVGPQAGPRARLRADRATPTSPNSSTRCARRPTRTTSHRPPSAWPGPASAATTCPARSPPSTSSRRPAVPTRRPVGDGPSCSPRPVPGSTSWLPPRPASTASPSIPANG